MGEKPRQPWVACLMTLLVRGLGHLYAGSPKRGIALYAIEQLLFFISAGLTLITAPNQVISITLFFTVIAFITYCVIDCARIAKGRNKYYEVQEYNKWYVYIGYYIIFLLVFTTLVSKIVMPRFGEYYKVTSGGMEPTLLTGDWMFIDHQKSAKEPRKGDIIVFECPKDRTRDFVKRVVAVGGDTVEVRQKDLFVNGTPVKNPYVTHKEAYATIPATQSPRDNFGPEVVPEGTYFTMGDNRDNTNDSRFWGVAPKDKIKGTVKSIYWSWDGETHAVRWNRIGMKVQ